MQDPLRLVRGESVEVCVDTWTEDAPACAKVSNEDGRLVLTLYTQKMTEVYNASLLRGVVSQQAFAYGVYCHEVAHILGGSFHECADFGYPISMQVAVMQVIDNILEDARIEYDMMRRYPLYAPYIQVVLSVLCWKLQPTGPDVVSVGSIEQDIQTAFSLARYGVVNEGADTAFVSFLLPLVLSAMRGDRHNAVVASRAVYTYLLAKHTLNPAQSPNEWNAANTAEVVQETLSSQDMQAMLAAQVVASNAHQAVLQTLAEAAAGRLSSEDVHERLAGADGPPPVEDERDDSFYEAVVAQYALTIQDLRNHMLRVKQHVRRLPSLDGDINYHRQNQAYTDSLLGQVGYTSTVFRRMIPDVQAALLQDVSSSTDDMAYEYAAAAVAVMAALDGEPGVEYAFIQFNSCASEVIPMGGSVRKNRVYPKAEGGTVLLPALQVAFGGDGEHPGYDWRARERYLIIITDGDIYDELGILPYLDSLRQEGIMVIGLNVCAGAVTRGWVEGCTLETLPEVVLAKITGEHYG